MAFSWSAISDAIYNAEMLKETHLQKEIRSIIGDYAFVWEWNKKMTFGLILSEDDTKLTHCKDESKGPNGWMTARGTFVLDGDYEYEWDIKIIDYHQGWGDIIIGVLCDDDHNPYNNNYTTKGNVNKCDNKEYEKHLFVDRCVSYSYHSYNNAYPMNEGRIKKHDTSSDFGGTFGGEKYGKPFFKNDIVTTVYNAKTKKLYFKINGSMQENGKEAFENINGKIVPFITVYSLSSSAKLMDVRFRSLHNKEIATIDTKQSNIKQKIDDDVKQNIDDENENNEMNEVKMWLTNTVKLPQYVDIFMEEGYDDMNTIIKTVTEQDLLEIGIKKRGHRKKIMLFIRELQDKNNNDDNVAIAAYQQNMHCDNNDVEGGNIYNDIVGPNIHDTAK